MRARNLVALAAVAALTLTAPALAQDPVFLGSLPADGDIALRADGDGPTSWLVPRINDRAVSFPTTSVGSTSTKSCYYICWGDNCTSSGTVTLDEALAAPFSVINLRRHTGPINGGGDCTGSAVSFPVSLSANQQLIMDFRFAPTAEGNFADTMIASGLVYSLTGSTPGAGTTCTPDSTTLCIEGRFRIRVTYSTVQGGGLAGSGRAIPLTSLGVTKGGLFWFFGADNPELLIKVLDGCGVNGKRWVYFSAGTNVGFTVTVVDLHTGATKTYTNPDLNPAAPLQDTSAFTCS